MTLVRTREEEFGEHQTRTLKFDIAPTGFLRTLWDKWHSIKNVNGRLPTAAELGGKTPLFFVDVTSENPFNYIMIRHPQGVCGNWEGQPLSQHPSKIHRQAIAKDWLYTKEGRAPALTEIDQTIMGVSRHYERLAVPIANSEGGISEIAYSFEFLSFPVINNPSISSSSSSPLFQARETPNS